MIFLENKKIVINHKLKNFLIALAILIATYLCIIYISQNDKTFDKELPVSNMQSTRKFSYGRCIKRRIHYAEYYTN